MSPKPALVDPDLGPLTDDLITLDFRVFQRAKGHRFSSDDVATAHAAFQARPEATRILDLGCGLGSVLLILAWKLPRATLIGVEAQAMSFELARRNVERNGVSERVTLHHGDLRDEALIARIEEEFPLITGTPPYFPKDAAIDAEDEQRAYARIEYRGGVEAYLETGARLLAKDGALVICGDARAAGRVEASARALGLSIVGERAIVAQEGKAPLFAIWTCSFEEGERVRSTLTLRDARGGRMPDADVLRVFSGFPRLLER